MKHVSKQPLFKVIVKRNPKAKKVLFYLTSYASSWRVYSIPISRFRRMGYEVVVYEFHDNIIENDDPSILPTATNELIKDMYRRQKEYEATGIDTFHGIGNSLGSFMLLNYTLQHPLPAIVLNGGGAIADVIFHNQKGSWKIVADNYTAKGYDHQKLSKLWAPIDHPARAKNIKVQKVLLMWSLNDGVIPASSSNAFAVALKSSNAKVMTKTDNLPHVQSVLINSLKVKSHYKFLNTL